MRPLSAPVLNAPAPTKIPAISEVTMPTTIATTTTIADGSYLFSGLLEGDYYVQFTPPTGYALTGKDLGGNDMTDEQFEQAGGNRSGVHVDFMIGSGDLDVDGVLPDGTAEPLMRKGEWAT